MLMIRQKISEMEMTTTSTTKIVSTGRSPMLMSHNCSCPPILSSKQTKSQQFVSILNKRQPGGGVQRTSRHSYNIIFNSIRKVFKSHFLTFALPFSHKQSLHKSRPGGTKWMAFGILRFMLSMHPPSGMSALIPIATGWKASGVFARIPRDGEKINIKVLWAQEKQQWGQKNMEMGGGDEKSTLCIESWQNTLN